MSRKIGELARQLADGDLQAAGPLLDLLEEFRDKRRRRLCRILAKLKRRLDVLYHEDDAAPAFPSGPLPEPIQAEADAGIREDLVWEHNRWRVKVEQLFLIDMYPANELFPQMDDLFHGRTLETADASAET